MELTDLFDIDYSDPIIILVSFIPACINFFIFLYVSVFMVQNRTTTIFSFFVLLLGIWQVADGFTHASNSTHAAFEWFRISGLPCFFVMPLGILFILRFTMWHKKVSNRWTGVLLFAPATVFEMASIARLDSYKITKSGLFGWIVSPEQQIITEIIYIWISVMGLLMLALLWIYYFKTKNDRQRRDQSLLLVIGFSVPVIGGIILEEILPLIFRIDSIPLTTALTTTFSVTSLVAIKKYKLFDYSPRHQWNKIVEAMNEGIVIVDNDGRIVYANKKYCRMVKYSYEELQGKVAKTLFINDASESQSNEGLFAEKNELAVQYQATMKTKCQEIIQVLISDSPYLNRNEKVIGSIGIYMEITQLIETQQKLKDKIKELNLFFYKTSHDLRAPVCSMNGLLAYYDKNNRPEEVVSYMRQCAQKLSVITDRISQIPDLYQGNGLIEKINIENKIADILKEAMETSNLMNIIKVKTNVSGVIMESEKYPVRLILKNLIQNALMFYDHKKANPFLNISVYKGRTHYKIKVSDNGQGMSDEVQKKAFEMFYKGTDNGKGEGLGLYIVKNAVERLQGKITLRSSINVGTKVVVYIPAPLPKINKVRYIIPEIVKPSNLTLFPI